MHTSGVRCSGEMASMKINLRNIQNVFLTEEKLKNIHVFRVFKKKQGNKQSH